MGPVPVCLAGEAGDFDKTEIRDCHGSFGASQGQALVAPAGERSGVAICFIPVNLNVTEGNTKLVACFL